MVAESLVTTAGAAGADGDRRPATVAKLASVPVPVPSGLVAMTRKWYVVPGFRPLTLVFTASALVPDPAETAGVWRP